MKMCLENIGPFGWHDLVLFIVYTISRMLEHGPPVYIVKGIVYNRVLYVFL